MKILLIEDDQQICKVIVKYFSDQGAEITSVTDGQTAMELVEKDIDKYSLILLDIMLPEVDGYELLEYIRPMEIPVIFITAKAGLEDRVRGLNLGAEDYIIKPFEIVELLARVKVVLRRYHKLEESHIQFRHISIDTENRKVRKEQTEIDLTPKEFELLLLFARNPNITLFRDKIYENVWETDFTGDTRTLDLHVQRLRKKLGLEDCLKTIYRCGYRLEV